MNAFKANRVYATEDDELIVVFQVIHDDQTHWMGETVTLGQEAHDVKVRVFVDQRANTEDGAQLDEGPYTVELWSDWNGVGGRRASLWERYEGIQAGVARDISVEVVQGEFLFLRVVEGNGQDNPVGDGDDEYDNQTGEYGPDGKRDNMDDAAWTAPIWFR